MKKIHVVRRGHWSVELCKQGDNGHPFETRNFRSFENAYSYFRFFAKYYNRAYLLWNGISLPDREYAEFPVVYHDFKWTQNTGEKYIYLSYSNLRDGLRELDS